jgi:hypothetical protein
LNSQNKKDHIPTKASVMEAFLKYKKQNDKTKQPI